MLFVLKFKSTLQLQKPSIHIAQFLIRMQTYNDVTGSFMDLDAEGLKYITLLLHIVCVTKKNMLPKKNLWEIPVSSIRQTEVELFCVITLNATGSIQTPAD